ncbi:MAG: hypothetical protein ABIZ36_12670 [Gemmatimonadaceae bacterium]
MIRSRVLFAWAFTALATTACTQASMPGDSSPNDGTGHDAVVVGTQQSDWAAIEKLERNAKAIAKTTGCSSSGECRSAPVGSKGCGGPRYYISWCAKSTDSAALYSTLDAVAAAERAYNKKYQIVSTCEFQVAPRVEVIAGACTAR